MAAFVGTPTGSTEYTAQTGATGGPILGSGGVLKSMPFIYTHATAAGAGTGEVNLCILPAGHLRTYSVLSSFVVAVAAAAGAQIHLGFRAYVQPDGTAVAEDDNYFLDNADATVVGAKPLVLPAAPGIGTFNVRYSTGAAYKGKGLVIYSLIDTGNVSIGTVISGHIVYAN